MIGWRGASRYYSENYREAFELECAAFKKVRDDMSIVNVKAMIPFCRDLNKAVKSLIRQVIKVARAKHVKIGLCGQAPSDYPEFARFLVEAGINSISLSPDTIVKTTLDIKKTEEKLGR
jgi:phosphoenolpyruvate synthase/pyruvate phosphate dikinase